MGGEGMLHKSSAVVRHATAFENDVVRRSGRIEDLERQMERLFRRLRMAVIFAGDKREDGAVINQTGNPRSWKSYEPVARDIAAALGRIGCRNVSVIAENMHLGERLKAERSHMAWLNSGGVQGYIPVSHAPAMLEMFGIPYVGHDPLTAGILDNKHTFKRQIQSAGIPTAPFVVWHGSQGRLDVRSKVFTETFVGWEHGFIVKPVSGRASLNVNFVQNAADVPDVVQGVYDLTQNHVLVEGYLGGREYCIAVCGPVVAQGGKLERRAEPFAFSAVERVLERDEKVFTSMDVRPISGERIRVLDPHKDGRVIARLKAIARDVFHEMSLETLVRLDVRADCTEENLFVLEANPKPDLKAPTPGASSIIALGLQAEGMSYDDLIYSLLADRVDVLLSRRRGTVEGLLRLIGEQA